MQTSLVPLAASTGRKQWSRGECQFLENAGLLKGRYELIDGEIIYKIGQNSRHAMGVIFVINYLLTRFLSTNCFPLCRKRQIRNPRLCPWN